MTPSPLVIDANNELLIDIRGAGIDLLIIGHDGLSVRHFDNDTRTFMCVADVIAWHEKELRESHGKSGDAQLLKVLQTAVSEVEAGDFTEG